MPFFAGARPMEYELLSLLLIVGIFLFPFLTSDSQPFYVGIYLLLSAFSSAWASFSDLNSTTSKILSRSPFLNRDAHDAVTLAVFAAFRYKSWGVLLQFFARHCQAISGGKLLSSGACSSIRKLLAERTVKFGIVWLEFLTVVELAILILWRHSLASILCFFVWIVVQSSFRYVTGESEKALWRELYKVIGDEKVRARGREKEVLEKVVQAADWMAAIATEMWPIKAKIQ
jgi:hypothetical protein